VAEEARRISPLVGTDDDLLVAAALLHDIGYAPRLVATGFHPLDGARYLTSLGAPSRLAALVARHACAVLEAEMRGLHAHIVAFHDEQTVTRDALWYCDMVTDPGGARVSFDARVAEVRRRYGESALVSRFITQAAAGELGAAVSRTLTRLRDAGIAQPRYG
jgi:putative nucleotidyltransferase with HDIG domain